MEKELILHATGSEVEIALLEGGKLSELHFQKASSNLLVGDIFLGRIKKLMPGPMNAAFVDIGQKKDSFLHYTDLGPPLRSLLKYTNAVMNSSYNTHLLDNFKPEPDIVKTGRIDQVFDKKSYALVQVLKEPIAKKGPRLTCEITIPGRFLVLSPFTNTVAVSKKIPDQNERQRLLTVLEGLKPKNFGVIVRTAAVGKKSSELKEELNFLLGKWERVYHHLKTTKVPGKLLSEIDKTSSILRDLLNDSFNKIIVDDKELFNIVAEYLDTFAPDQKNILQHYKGGKSLFEAYGVNKQIKTSFGKTTSLESGAYLVIETTEAMHVIDVNSGHKVSTNSVQAEEILFKTNMEAAEEIARQIRLRDIGGLIVIDFIDMKSNEHRKQLYITMTELMKKDRAQHTILPISKFGLMQITRQRVRPEIDINTSEVCPSCNGSGKVSPSILINEEIEKGLFYVLQSRPKNAKVSIHVHPYVEAFLKKGLPSIQHRWLLNLHRWIPIHANPNFHIREYKFFDENEDEIRI